MRKFLVVPLLFVLAGCAEPLFIVAGGALSGTGTPVPSDWGMARDIEVVQVETRPSDPYSVNVWGVGVGDRFYVAAVDREETEWALGIEGSPLVKLRLDGRLYALTATRLNRDEHADEIDRVKATYAEKYELDAESNFIDEAWVYRLTPRES